MIKSQKQANVAKERLNELQHELQKIEEHKEEISSAQYELGRNSLIDLLDELNKELLEFDELINGNFHCFKPEKLSDINRILIAARIAKKMTQKELGDLLGVQEQQIQRYEATDYESASWVRIQEVSYALNIKFYFEKILLLSVDNTYSLPPDTDSQMLERAKRNLKDKKTLICIE